LVVAAALLQDQPRITTAGVEDWPALADRVASDAHDGDRVLMPAKVRAPFDYAWAEGGSRPDLDPLSPTDPLGGVRRFYDPTPGTMRDRLLADATETVWYVDRDIGRLDDVEALLSDPDVTRRYRSSGPQAFDGELYLVRFEPRPG
jgi:hypothetical protein